MKKSYLRNTENVLPPLKPEERIYLKTTYETKDFAKAAHCKFDDEKKLWYTGSYNRYLSQLIDMYGIHPETAEKVLEMLKARTEDKKGNTLILSYKNFSGRLEFSEEDQCLHPKNE